MQQQELAKNTQIPCEQELEMALPVPAWVVANRDLAQPWVLDSPGAETVPQNVSLVSKCLRAPNPVQWAHGHPSLDWGRLLQAEGWVCWMGKLEKPHRLKLVVKQIKRAGCEIRVHHGLQMEIIEVICKECPELIISFFVNSSVNVYHLATYTMIFFFTNLNCFPGYYLCLAQQNYSSTSFSIAYK